MTSQLQKEISRMNSSQVQKAMRRFMSRRQMTKSASIASSQNQVRFDTSV